MAILTQKGYEAVELWGLKQPRVKFFKDCVQVHLRIKSNAIRT